MKTFRINKNYSIICSHKNTSRGFKHEAVLIESGREIAKTSVHYLNRTRERYRFETVMSDLLYNNWILTKQEKQVFLDACTVF